MPTIVTYNLRQKQQNSDEYYKRIQQIAETISKQLTLHFQKELEDFEEYIRDQQIEKPRSREEYGLELLMLGVYNSLYQSSAQQLKKWQETLLTHVASMRQKTHLRKTFYSKLKGILTTKYLVKNIQNHSNTVGNSASLEQLISYLKASGEFEEAVVRLNHWHAFLSLSPSKEAKLLKKCTKQCPINQVTQLGKKYGAHTIIVEHGSDLYKTKVQGPKFEKGVIGVACVLNLLEGGWKALQLGYVPQCVILDYCGCKQHWHEKGITTTINCNRLEYLLESE